MPTECDKMLDILGGKDLTILKNFYQRLNNAKLQTKGERINVQINDKTSFLITPGDLIKIKEYIKDRISFLQESELSSDSGNYIDIIERARRNREEARGRNHSDNGRPPIIPNENPSKPIAKPNSTTKESL